MRFFEILTQINSLSVIHRRCEKILEELDADDADILTDKESMTIKRILDTNSLDEAWLLAYEHEGNEVEAAKIRKWLLGKPGRDAQKPANPLLDSNDTDSENDNEHS